MANEEDPLLLAIREYYARRSAKNADQARGRPDEPAKILEIAAALRDGKITEEEIPKVLKRYRETGKLFDGGTESQKPTPSASVLSNESPEGKIVSLPSRWMLPLSAAAILLLIGLVWWAMLSESPNGNVVKVPGEILMASDVSSKLVRGIFSNVKEFKLKLVLEPGRESLTLIGGRTTLAGPLINRTVLGPTNVRFQAILTNGAAPPIEFRGEITVGYSAITNLVEVARLSGKTYEPGKPPDEFNTSFSPR